MILHPGILALIAGSVIVVAMMLNASWTGVGIICRWDINSSSSGQLVLERKTYLVSALMNYVFAFEVLSLLLFIYTADDIHRLFTGAMCATGSLNANPVGWYVLLSKVLVFFVSLAWIAFNYIDQTAEDYPLVKMKYRVLLCITPLIIVDAVLQFIYFSGLDPVIITSCCGSLFSAEGAGIVSSMSSFPLGKMMTGFYVSISAYMISAFFSLRSGNSLFKYLTSILAFILFAVSVMAVVSFISLYFYELPTHHCPFDILQKDYFYIGYPLYVTLFLGVFFGMMAGIVDPYQKYNSIAGTIQRLQKKWIITSVVMLLIFTVISSWQVIFSDLSMKGYQ